jgi:hypothetical protein
MALARGRRIAEGGFEMGVCIKGRSFCVDLLRVASGMRNAWKPGIKHSPYPYELATQGIASSKHVDQPLGADDTSPHR